LKQAIVELLQVLLQKSVTTTSHQVHGPADIGAFVGKNELGYWVVDVSNV